MIAGTHQPGLIMGKFVLPAAHLILHFPTLYFHLLTCRLTLGYADPQLSTTIYHSVGHKSHHLHSHILIYVSNSIIVLFWSSGSLISLVPIYLGFSILVHYQETLYSVRMLSWTIFRHWSRHSLATENELLYVITDRVLYQEPNS